MWAIIDQRDPRPYSIHVMMSPSCMCCTRRHSTRVSLLSPIHRFPPFAPTLPARLTSQQRVQPLHLCLSVYLSWIVHYRCAIQCRYDISINRLNQKSRKMEIAIFVPESVCLSSLTVQKAMPGLPRAGHAAAAARSWSPLSLTLIY